MTAERVIGAALGLFAALFAIVRANRSAAFDLAITLKLQEREHPALGDADARGVVARLPAAVAAHPAGDHRRVVAGRPAARRRVPARRLGRRRDLHGHQGVHPRGRGRSRPRCASSSRRSAARASRAATCSRTSASTASSASCSPSTSATVRCGTRPWRASPALLALVGPSRIQQGHHWTTDVVASYLLGTAYLLALVELYRVDDARACFDRLLRPMTEHRRRRGHSGDADIRSREAATRAGCSSSGTPTPAAASRRRRRCAARRDRGGPRGRTASTPSCFESDSEADTDAPGRRGASRDGVATIVAAGGDGTVRSIAFQLLDRDVALGILPLGTAMNVARSLDIPLELDGAAAVLAAGHAAAIDVGEVRGQPVPRDRLDRARRGGPRRRDPRRRGPVPCRVRRCSDAPSRQPPHARPAPARRSGGPRAARCRSPIANGRVHRPRDRARARGAPRRRPFDVLLLEGFGPLGSPRHSPRVLLGRGARPAVPPLSRRDGPDLARIGRCRSASTRRTSARRPSSSSRRPGALRVIAPR